MPLNRKLFRQETGEDLDNILKSKPTLKDLRNEAEAQLISHFPVRILGLAQDGQQFLTEEDRESHIHVLGAPSQGKSKFLEYMICEDLKRGYGACLLDPSFNGDTMQKVLKWCAKQGFEKICIIDPHDREKFVPAIAPRHNLMDTVRILFKNTESTDTPRIRKYLPALFHILRKTELSLYELRYFSSLDNPFYVNRRKQVFDRLDPHDLLDDKIIRILDVFSKRQIFVQQFESTINRLEPFTQKYLSLLFGLTKGIDFAKLITDGWLILCNLDPDRVEYQYETVHSQLIGISIVNELFDAMFRLSSNGWKGVYYLYIDEVGQFATRSIASIMDLKRKSGLRLTMAHQRFNQFEDFYVRDAVESAGIKVLFQTQLPEDRMKMIRMMYGGDLSDREVSYTLSGLAKKHAVIKINKGKPAVTRLPEVPDVVMSRSELDAFKEKIYKRDEWYHSPEEILNEINARFKETKPGRPARRQNEEARSSPKVPVSGAEDDRQPTRAVAPKPRPQGNVEALFSETELSRPAGQTKNSSSPSQPRKRKSRTPKQGEDSAGGSPPLGTPES